VALLVALKRIWQLAMDILQRVDGLHALHSFNVRACQAGRFFALCWIARAHALSGE
jgi:hypothetical protein